MAQPEGRATLELVRDPQPGAPLVSVIIVNYNYGALIGAAIDSVLRQSYRRFELVICDDGSRDDSRDVIRSYAEQHPEVIRPLFKENGGVASALNAAFASSSGDIISFLDADDLFAPDKLERVVRAFEAGVNVGLVVNRMAKLTSDGQMTGLIPQFGRLDRGWLREKVLAGGGHWSFAPTSGLSLSRGCADRLFPIPEDEFRTEADSYIYTQATLFWPVAAIDEPVSTLRLHSSNITSSERMTAAYARRVTASIERMCRALERTTSSHGLPRPRIERNPVYAEMTFVGDLLEGRGRLTVLNDLKRVWTAALSCRTNDRVKVMSKPLVLSVAAVLPRRASEPLLQAVYAPTGLRTKIARFLTRRGSPPAVPQSNKEEMQ
jgi:hypothetical protein